MLKTNNKVNIIKAAYFMQKGSLHTGKQRTTANTMRNHVMAEELSNIFNLKIKITIELSTNKVKHKILL